MLMMLGLLPMILRKALKLNMTLLVLLVISSRLTITLLRISHDSELFFVPVIYAILNPKNSPKLFGLPTALRNLNNVFIINVFGLSSIVS